MDSVNIFVSFCMDDDAEAVLSSAMQCIANLTETSNSRLMGERDPEARARNQYYFENTIPRYNDLLFKEHFRMGWGTFQKLLLVIGNAMSGNQDSSGRLSKKSLFTVWVLAKPETFLAAGDRFDLAKTTAYRVFREIIATIAGLLSQYIKFPSRSERAREAQIFQRRSRGFPGIVGAIDGCHIPIKAPVGNANDFYNRNKIHSIVLQGTCDHKARFIDVFIGMPGRMHDAMVFRKSDLYQKLYNEESPLIPPNYHLLGDSAYPLSENLLTPFRDNGRLSRRQTNYNVKLSTGRSIIERAYGFLKGKFRRLKYLDISDPSTANKIVAAACVLHNFLINCDEIEFEDEDEDKDEEIIDGVSDEEALAQAGRIRDDSRGISKRNNILATLL